MRMRLACLLLLAPLLPAEDAFEGKAIYRSNCAFCHGLTGGGGRGPALAGRQFLHGQTDADIRAVILEGVPGTNMPSYSQMDAKELDNLVAFIQGMSRSGVQAQRVAGDTANGRRVYDRSGCAGCHRIGSEGSVFGPELTRIGAGRSPEYLRASVLDPSADIPPEFEGVTVVTAEGGRITGVRVNEDTFSVQLRDPGQKFRMFKKDEVRQVVHETRSLMPAYRTLSPADLRDLLAYMDTLRGDVKAGADTKKAEGIK